MINSISIDITNCCNFDCVHCLRDKMAPRGHMALDILEELLSQATSLGIRQVCLTGGEVSLHPYLGEVFDLHARYGVGFNMVSNGYLFLERVLPRLHAKRRDYLTSVCFSLDGATPRSHHLLRRKEGSFEKTVEAIKACGREGIPVSVKCAMHRGNLDEILDVAFLCASLGVTDLGFLVLTPTPRLLSEGLMPTPQEYRKAIAFIKGRIMPSFSMPIGVEGVSDSGPKIPLCNPAHSLSVDHQGNLIFCCNLSHPTAGDREDELGREFLGNMRDGGLEEGILRHYRLWGWFVEESLKFAEKGGLLTCDRCLELFGKMAWRKESGSPHHKNR